MGVIYTSKGISNKFGVRVIYRKIRYWPLHVPAALNLEKISHQYCDAVPDQNYIAHFTTV